MNNDQKLVKALELLAEATKLLNDIQGGKVHTLDSGGSNPPGPGQPGKP